MKYTIGEFAKILGVTIDTLRQYERKGIIKPYHDEINNYRYYDDEDIKVVSTSKYYSSLGFSLSQTREMISGVPISSLAKSFAQQQIVLQKKLRLEEAKLNMVQIKFKLLSSVESMQNKYEEIILPSFVQFCHSSNNRLSQDDDVTSVLKEWVKFLPITFFSMSVPLDVINEPTKDFRMDMTMLVDKSHAEEFELLVTKEMKIIPARKYIYTVSKCVNRNIIDIHIVQDIIDYVKGTKYSPIGDAIIVHLGTENYDGNKCNYHVTYIPVENM